MTNITTYLLLFICFIGLTVIAKMVLSREGMADISSSNRAHVDHERYATTTTDLTKDTVLSVYRNAMNKGEWEWEWMNNRRPEHYYRDPYYPKPKDSPLELIETPESKTVTYTHFEQNDAPKTGFDGWVQSFKNSVISPAQLAPEPVYNIYN